MSYVFVERRWMTEVIDSLSSIEWISLRNHWSTTSNIIDFCLPNSKITCMIGSQVICVWVKCTIISWNAAKRHFLSNLFYLIEIYYFNSEWNNTACSFMEGLEKNFWLEDSCFFYLFLNYFVTFSYLIFLFQHFAH